MNALLQIETLYTTRKKKQKNLSYSNTDGITFNETFHRVKYTIIFFFLKFYLFHFRKWKMLSYIQKMYKIEDKRIEKNKMYVCLDCENEN